MNDPSRFQKYSLPSQITTWSSTIGRYRRGSNGFVYDSRSPSLAPASPLPKLPELPRVLEFPLKTSPFELSAEEGTASTEQNSGLFGALLGDPRVLYQAYLDSPEDFDQETSELLTKLVSRQKVLNQLTAEEKSLLDQATVSFAQHSSRSKPKPKESPNVLSVPTATTAPSGERQPMVWRGDKMRLQAPQSVPFEIPTVPTQWWDKEPGGGLR